MNCCCACACFACACAWAGHSSIARMCLPSLCCGDSRSESRPACARGRVCKRRLLLCVPVTQTRRQRAIQAGPAMLKKGSKLGPGPPSTTWIREEQIDGDRDREGEVARLHAVRVYCIPTYLCRISVARRSWSRSRIWCPVAFVRLAGRVHVTSGVT